MRKPAIRTAPSAQRGLALIMAVLIAALATSAIAFAAWRQQVRLRAAELQQESAQAQEIARATISIARVLLMQERRRSSQPYVDSADEEWAKPRQYDVERGVARGQVTDLQGRFNLNRIVPSNDPNSPPDLAAVGVYSDLLRALRIPNSGELVDALIDWMDNNGSGNKQPQGAEDEYYLQLPKPYRTANSGLADLSDLLKVKGYTPEIVKQLEPHVVVYPNPSQDNHVNFNLTTPELLRVHLPLLSENDAKQIVQNAKTNPYSDLNDLWQKTPAMQKAYPGGLSAMGSLVAYLQGGSNYFLLDLDVRYGKVLWKEKVMLNRSGDGSTSTTIWRKRVPD